MMDHSPDSATDVSSTDPRLTYAWNAYWAQENWSRNVDNKASTALALETAVLGVVLGALKGDPAFASADEWRRALTFAGLGLLLLAVLVAGLAIVPHIRRELVQRDDPDELRILWFGHLRQLNAAQIHDNLRQLSSERCVEILAGELVTLSRLNWGKATRLRLSMLFAFVGAILVSIAVWPIYLPFTPR